MLSTRIVSSAKEKRESFSGFFPKIIILEFGNSFFKILETTKAKLPSPHIPIFSLLEWVFF